MSHFFYVTEHSLEAQLTAKISLENILNLFCIWKNLLFMGEAMTADSSHKKKKNKQREPKISI